MDTSHPHLVWANKPGCSWPVAELWIGESNLLFVIFVDDNDKTLKIEVLPLGIETAHVIDISEVERLIETAKRDLWAMCR